MPTKDEIRNFSLMLREYAERNKLGLWDALNLYCETFNVESEVAASQLSRDILADLTIEVSDLNLLKERGKKSGRLEF